MSGSPLWRIVRVSPTSAPAWDQTGAALARSKRLNHYPVVAAYFWHARRAGCSTIVSFSMAANDLNIFNRAWVHDILMFVYFLRFAFSNSVFSSKF